MSAPSTPTKRSAGTNEQRALLLLSPQAKNSVRLLETDRELTAKRPPQKVLKLFWDKSQPQLAITQTATHGKMTLKGLVKQKAQEEISEMKQEHAILSEKKADAIDFLKTVDITLVDLQTGIQIGSRQANDLEKQENALAEVYRTVTYLLTHSNLKDFAWMPFEAIRLELDLNTTTAVRKLSFLGCIAVLHIITNMGLAEHPNFEGENPNESNDFKGLIYTGKGDTSRKTMQDRIIFLLKVPDPSPVFGAATAGTNAVEAAASGINKAAADILGIDPDDATTAFQPRPAAQLQLHTTKTQRMERMERLRAELAALESTGDCDHEETATFDGGAGDDGDEDATQEPPTKKLRK